MADWADEIAGRLEDELNNTDQSDHFIALPFGVAPALRKAKADGMREAADAMLLAWINSTKTWSPNSASRKVYLAASKLDPPTDDKIEKGEANG